MKIPPALRKVTDALVAVDEAIEDVTADPSFAEIDGYTLFLIMSYGRNTAHTLADILALYPLDRDEEDIWHQASL